MTRDAIIEALKYDERIWRAYLTLKTCHQRGFLDELQNAASHNVYDLAKQVVKMTKHGPDGSGNKGPCDTECLKCLAEKILKESGMKGYAIILTPDEVSALKFIGSRYQWTGLLLDHLDEETGGIEFPEHVMWQWNEDVEDDMEGGHSAFPMASDEFAKKLHDFLDSMV